MEMTPPKKAAEVANQLPEAPAHAISGDTHSRAATTTTDTLRIEAWLRTEVATAYDEIHADPSRTVSSETVRAQLQDRHRNRPTSDR